MGLLVGIVALVLGAAAELLPQPEDLTSSKPLVVFLGDSLTAGLHVGEERSFANVVHETLAGEGHEFRLANAGASGDTTVGGLARITLMLRRRPAIVVVELGGNDGLQRASLASIETNLREIVTRSKGAGARVLLLAMALPASVGEAYARDFAAIYPRVAEDLDVPLVERFLEGVGGVPAMNHPDGIHPTVEGHRRLADNVVPALRALLVAREGSPAAPEAR